MSQSAAYLLIFVGALLIASGCAHPLDVAVTAANTAAKDLHAVHAALTKARRVEQRAAARRVLGDRDDRRVRAEQLDRAHAVGLRYQHAWDAYARARKAWLVTVRMLAALDDNDARAQRHVLHVALLRLAVAMRHALFVSARLTKD